MKTTKKVTVSMPAELVADIERRIAEGQAESVSGYLASLARDRLDTEQMLDAAIRDSAELVALIEAEHGPIPPGDWADADAFLDRALIAGPQQQAS